jgi:hypothetical protein
MGDSTKPAARVTAPAASCKDNGSKGPPALPEWILDSQDYASLTPHQKGTLNAIARRCSWEPYPDGTLAVAVCGGDFAEEAFVGRSGLYRHLRLLERAGFLRCVGLVGRAGVKAWAIPGRPACLDNLKAGRLRNIEAAREYVAAVCDPRLGQHPPNPDACSNEHARVGICDPRVLKSPTTGAQLNTNLLGTPKIAQGTPPAARGDGGGSAALEEAIVREFGLNIVTDDDRRRIERLARNFSAKAEAGEMDPVFSVGAKAAAFRASDTRTPCTPELVLHRWDALASAAKGSTYHSALRRQTEQSRREDAETRRAIEAERQRVEGCPHPPEARELLAGGHGAQCKACGKVFFATAAAT